MLTRTCGALAGLLLSGAAAAESVAWEWLGRMNEAVRTQTYVGTAVLRSGKRIDTLLIHHAFVDGVERERVVSLSGAQREVIRAGGEVQVILPEQRLVVIERDQGRGLLPQLSESALARIAQHYALELHDPKGRVANRNTRELRIDPRDEWRWGYRIQLDEQTAMPLELRIVAPDQSVLEQIQFVTVDFPDVVAEDALSAQADSSGYAVVRSRPPHVDGQARAMLSGWEVASPPPGFRLSARNWTSVPGADGPVAHWVFSDGLASVSLYATSADGQDDLPEARMASGAVSTVRRMHQQMQVTVMGEVPVRTARRFAAGLQRVPAP